LFLPEPRQFNVRRRACVTEKRLEVAQGDLATLPQNVASNRKLIAYERERRLRVRGKSEKLALLAILSALVASTVAFAQSTAPPSQPPPKAAASPAPLPTVDQILNKYLENSGGRAAWQKLNSRVSKGTVEIPTSNISGALEMWEKAPNRLIVTVTVAGTVFSQGFDGTVGWSNDPQNGLREETPAELAETKREADFYHPLHFRELYSKISVAGKERIGERWTFVIEATPPEGGEPDKIYFDEQTGAVDRAVTQHHNPDGSVEPFQEDFEDYRTVDGVKIPFTIHQSNSQAAFMIKISEVHHNVEVDDAKFGKPVTQ
jgi:hypothetical protein